MKNINICNINLNKYFLIKIYECHRQAIMTTRVSYATAASVAAAPAPAPAPAAAPVAMDDRIHIVRRFPSDFDDESPRMFIGNEPQPFYRMSRFEDIPAQCVRPLRGDERAGLIDLALTFYESQGDQVEITQDLGLFEQDDELLLALRCRRRGYYCIEQFDGFYKPYFLHDEDRGVLWFIHGRTTSDGKKRTIACLVQKITVSHIPNDTKIVAVTGGCNEFVRSVLDGNRIAVFNIARQARTLATNTVTAAAAPAALEVAAPPAPVQRDIAEEFSTEVKGTVLADIDATADLLKIAKAKFAEIRAKMAAEKAQKEAQLREEGKEKRLREINEELASIAAEIKTLTSGNHAWSEQDDIDEVFANLEEKEKTLNALRATITGNSSPAHGGAGRSDDEDPDEWKEVGSKRSSRKGSK